jgi:hypothetical protein
MSLQAANIYEQDESVNQYAAFHFDDERYYGVENFARVVAEVRGGARVAGA